MSSAKEIRTKITSIKSTQKITRAMEMVAASKMKKAQQAMQRTRPYAINIRRMIGHIMRASLIYQHPFSIERDVKRVGYIVVSTDRGLCGGLNINLFKKVIEAIMVWKDQNVDQSFCLFGNKAVSFFNRFDVPIKAVHSFLNTQPTIESLVGGIRVMLEAYMQGEIDCLYIAYNRFINTMTQEPTIQKLLPFEASTDNEITKYWDYIYEPNAEVLLDGLIQRYIETQIYQSVMENQASEQAARMVAMKSATDNAHGLIDDLQLIYNKARQSAITQEISEIVSGAQAI